MSIDQPSESILSSESLVVKNRDAQSMNITAGKIIGDVVRTTLGPRGMDKLLIDSAGMGIVTNDGASIIREMDIDHPAANLVATVAKKQEETVGDGTTSAVTITSALLGNAEKLLNQGLHPTVIAEGYALALSAAIEELREAAVDIDNKEDGLKPVVKTAMSARGLGVAQDTLVNVAASAARAAWENGNDPETFTNITKDVGGDVSETWILDGIILKNDRAHPGMPAFVEDPAVAVLDGLVDAETNRGETNIKINNPDQITTLHEGEREQRYALAEALLDVGVDALITTDDVAPAIQQRLANSGVYVTRRQSPDDIEKAAQATGATIQHSVDVLSSDDLGSCETIVERIAGGKSRTSIEGVPRKNATTIVLRGGTRNVVDEVHRTLEDGLSSAGTALANEAVVPGGGGGEVLAAEKIRERARTIDDRVQLAITAFADALEVVPRTLAENSDRSPLEVLTNLRYAYNQGHDVAAINATTGAIIDAHEDGIIDPLHVKVQALKSATQVATMLLRIDNVVAADQLIGGAVTADTDVDTES